MGKKLIKIPPSSGHLRYDRFKQNFKINDYIYQKLEALSDNAEATISSSILNICHYIDEYCEDEFTSSTSDFGLIFLDEYLLLKIQV